MMLWSSLLLLSSGLLGVSGTLVARCPTPGSSEASYCNCSNSTMVIRCNFKKKGDVLLTKDLLAPYNNLGFSTAYVRVENATSVNVSSEFLGRLLEVSSAAFDIWHVGRVTLNASPRSATINTSKPGAFVGVGIVDCIVPEVPAGFLRDRVRGAFRIKDSKVGILREGFIYNVTEIRYIVLEDSVVEEVEGSVSAEGYLTISQLEVHSWNGLLLSNVTINEVGSGAFNLTHKSDMEVMSVSSCRMMNVASGAFAVTGDFTVTVRGNVFRNLEKEAFKVNVTGNVYFNGNIMGAKGVDVLSSVRCHNSSSLQNNTVLLSSPRDLVLNEAVTPFQASCGKPQLFMVVSPLRRMVVVEDMRAAWVLVGALTAMIIAVAASVAWILRRRRPVLSRTRFPFHKGNNHTASLENLPRNIELSNPREDPEEGTSVKDLDMPFNFQQDTEAPRFDEDEAEAEEAAQSDSSCDVALP